MDGKSERGLNAPVNLLPPIPIKQLKQIKQIQQPKQLVVISRRAEQRGIAPKANGNDNGRRAWNSRRDEMHKKVACRANRRGPTSEVCMHQKSSAGRPDAVSHEKNARVPVARDSLAWGSWVRNVRKSVIGAPLFFLCLLFFGQI